MGIIPVILLFSACLPRPLDPMLLPTDLPSATPTISPSPTLTALPTFTPPPTAYPYFDPAGCRKPPDDYSLLEVNGWTLNARTYAMLEHASELYGGQLDITGHAITQGSYHDNGSASWGTHLGGGAVDLSVMQSGTYTILWDEIPLLIRALRVAGFAAWLRRYGEIYPDSPWHIHAIAVGDAELSQPARDQVDGVFGYLRGFTGVPQENGIPKMDLDGEPVLCSWMVDLGYADLRPVDLAIPYPWSDAERIRAFPVGLVMEYIVQPGDTIAGVALHYYTDIQAIAKASGLDNIRQLEVGQVLFVPVNLK